MKQFTINRDKHYCKWWWTKLLKPRFGNKKWSVVFLMGSDDWRSTPRNPDDYDINKLYGVGFGFNHHKNSWRIGWNWDFEKLNTFNIFAYVYDEQDGHISKLIGKVEGDKACSITVESTGSKYRFKSNDLGATVEMPNVNKDCWLQFDLYPYHGGNNTAPKKETFFIEFKPK